MTGKDMLQGIQNLDAELIEESEFGTFGKGKARGFGKKKLLTNRLISALLTSVSCHWPGMHASISWVRATTSALRFAALFQSSRSKARWRQIFAR